MVQIIKGGVEENQAKERLGYQMGKNLSDTLINFGATKALDNVLNDKSLADKPDSEKMGALQRALQPYGQKGLEILQQRMQVKQMEQQEKQEKINSKHSEIMGKILNDQPVSEKERNSLPAELSLALAKHKQAGELAKYKMENKSPAGGVTAQPPTPERANAIEKVINENPDSSPDQLAIAFSKAGIPDIFSNRYVENRRRDVESHANLLEKGYKSQEEYLNGLTSSLGATEQMDLKLDRIAELGKNGEVPTPLLYETMQALGIPTAIFSAKGEELEKLSNDLTKNIQQFYGSRILQSEFQNFLKSIPTLKNSQEGRERIIANMKMFNNLKRLEYNTARGIELDYEAKNKPLPPSFQRIVYDKMAPEAEKFANEWKNAQTEKLKPKNNPEIGTQKQEMKPPQPGMKIYKAPDGESYWMTPEMVEEARKEDVEFSE
jgi:hypothetical protein